jgi:hypothetical protein
MYKICFIGCLLFSAPGEAAEVLLYAPGDARMAAELVNADQTVLSTQEGVEERSIAVNTKSYAQQEWQFRFKRPFLQGWNRLFVEVTFLDKGAGVIQPRLLRNDSFSGEWVDPIRAVSFTRLNTGQVRRALFEFTPAALDWMASTHVHLKIAGLQSLLRLRVFSQVSTVKWNAVRDSVPVDVQPMVKLNRPMQINCTVGIADVGNPPPLAASLENIREYAPLAKVLGFTSIECFVRWDMIEPHPGAFDFSHYDRIVEAIRRYGLKWFPNLVITSAFALPSWFFEQDDYTPFRCLEHDQINQSPSIWNAHNREHVVRVLNAFGGHYGAMGVLEAVRLGPSGNFGEAQYPAGAGGTLGFQGKRMHAHIGWWAGDSCARVDFQRFLSERYTTVERLNAVWEEQFTAFDQPAPQLPEHFRTRQGRLDMTEWYTASMSNWCGFWAQAARHAMPDIPIYQSAGGWGYRESGTDFSALSESMRDSRGGIRLTNETDSFEQNFYATRLASTAARLYGIMLGYEPAGFHSARGVGARFFTCIATNADNLYTRHQVLFTRPDAVANWLRDYPLLDQRANPLVDVAIYYPETMSQLDDGAFRYLYAWGFNPRAAEVRRRIDADFLDERLIRAGFLERYKVLVFCWGNVINADVQQAIDRWIRAGGVAIYPARNPQETVQGNSTLFTAWERGDTGNGVFYRFQGDMEPISFYGDFVENALRNTPSLHRWTQSALRIQRPPRVYLSVLENGTLFALNYNEQPVSIALEGHWSATLQPYILWSRLLE